MWFSYVFLAVGPYYQLSQEEAAKAAAEAKASKASEESGDRWVAKPQWKTVETRGKPPWKSPLFPTNSGKISKNILRNSGKSTIFSFILFVASATGLGWFIQKWRGYFGVAFSTCWTHQILQLADAQGAQGLGNSESSIISGCIHQSFTHYMNASLDPVGKLHLFWICYHWCK